jgi:hypothetical protein
VIVRSAAHVTRQLRMILAVVATTVAISRDASAQAGRRPPVPRVQPEVRADFINARARAAHVGVGFSVPASTYVRLGLVGAGGPAWSDSATAFSGRADAVARFVVDPLRESRWAPYASGGLGVLYDEDDRWRAVLVGALGVEGPVMGRLVPAIEIGFGGGARVGLAFRRAIPGRR